MAMQYGVRRFTTLANARVFVEAGSQDYNEQRPHSALNCL